MQSANGFLEVPSTSLTLQRCLGTWRAARSKASRIHSDLDFLPICTAASISATSGCNNRQYNRLWREEPSGSDARACAMNYNSTQWTSRKGW